MYPIGHVAVSYLVARPALHSQATNAEMAGLTAGTLFPAASNIALQNLNVFDINHVWSHSPLMLVPLGLLGIAFLWMPFSFRRVPLIFALGVLSHLVVDIIFDFPLIYFSNDVDDMGGAWFYPWQPFLIRYNEPGFDIQPWELMIESGLLGWIVWKWRRWDLAVYSAIATGVTIYWEIFLTSRALT